MQKLLQLKLYFQRLPACTQLAEFYSTLLPITKWYRMLQKAYGYMVMAPWCFKIFNLVKFSLECITYVYFPIHFKKKKVKSINFAVKMY